MPLNAVEKSFCTTTDAARLLGVSVATVQIWTESGLLTAWKTDGGHRRIMRTSVDKLLYNSATRAAPEIPATRHSAAQLRPTRVMVVDDDVNLLRLYQVHMQTWPMAVELQTFDNAFSALLMVGRDAPDLLVVDLQMPELDGFGMLKILQSEPTIKSMRIVVVTGMDATSISNHGGVPSGIEVLPKPVPFARLQAIAQEIQQVRKPQTAIPLPPPDL